MPEINMPDGASVRFPDDMPPETIRGLISQKFPEVAQADARQRLGVGLSGGQRGDADIYRTAAFRSNIGVPRATAADLAAQGATLGWGDEIAAAATAPIDMAVRGEGFGEAYRHNLAAERDRLAQYRAENPKTAFASELAGGLVLPPGAAGPIKTGAVTGAIAGAGGSEGDSLAQRGVDAVTGGAIGGGLGAVASVGGRALTGRGPSAQPTAEELKAVAGRGYQSEAVKSLELDPKQVSDAVSGIRARLDEAGFDDVIASKAHTILKKLEAAPEDATITGQNLRTVQKTLGKAAGSIDPQEKAGASIALREFNNFLENVPAARRGSPEDFASTVKEANANYSAAKTAESLDRRVAAKKLRSEAQNSGMNAAALIRQDMATIVNNPRLSRGMRPDEVAQAQQIAEGTRPENMIRVAGNAMGGGGGLGAVAAAGLGYGVGGPHGLAVPVGGMLLRYLSNRMTLANANKLSDMIRSRAPLAQATGQFEQRAAQFRETRDARSAAAAALAARNLAGSLNAAGLNISAADLMRAATQGQ